MPYAFVYATNLKIPCEVINMKDVYDVHNLKFTFLIFCFKENINLIYEKL